MIKTLGDSVLFLAGTPEQAMDIASGLIEVMHEDYVTTARAKGLNQSVAVMRHAVRNALLPIITVLALHIPALFSGAAFHGQTSWQTSQPKMWLPRRSRCSSGIEPRYSIVRYDTHLVASSS